MFKIISLYSVCFLISYNSNAQQKDIASLGNNSDSAIENYSAYQRGLGFAGLLQTRYVGSLTKNVDINGKHFDPAQTKGNTNSFLIKRARVQVKANINDHFSANLMTNFAEFSSDPITKVLENAYIKYRLNSHLNIQAGQFRPFFGIEDALPVDLIRTLDYSNQYYAFGSNGWQSFQIGISVFGDVTKKGQLPLRYYAGVYNGNNRNQSTDNDNGKNIYARLESDLQKDLTIGINAAYGSQGNGTGNAFGIDMLTGLRFSSKWRLMLGAEYKNGSNFVLHNSITTAPKPDLSEFRMQGFYIFPILRYEYKQPRVRAIELSSRYEYYNENYKQEGNVRQTIIPNLTVLFADDYYVALQAGIAIDMYKREVPLTSAYSHSLGYVQLQIRF
jgi:hypothetical protein